MLELAAVGPNDVVYDLGCGDGRIVIEAARRYGARVVSHWHRMGEWRPARTITVRDESGRSREVFLWVKK